MFLQILQSARREGAAAGPRSRRRYRRRQPALEAGRAGTGGPSLGACRRGDAGKWAAFRRRTAAGGTTPADWLRQAGLSRRLPSLPVPAINREHYAELARLSGNLNQLTRLANSGQPVSVADGLLQRVIAEVSQLRRALLGLGLDAADDR